MISRRNIPLFIAFRVLFNARFYYPILGVLFLDLGLTLEQYALLNVVWAVAIVTLEIPSGALADLIGRKRMVVLAAVFMVVELGIFSFAPAGNASLFFALLVVNRLLSGAAEAAASGADEALAYDSMAADGRVGEWPNVLATLMRWQSGAFFVAMVAGGALYDAAFVGNLAAWFGMDWVPAQAATVRWPVYATLATAVLCLGVALALREPLSATRTETASVGRALRNIWLGARCVVTDRRILFVIMAGLVCDSAVRLFLTFASNFYRLIELPPVANGVIGSGFALLGFVAAPLARRLVERGSAGTNFLIAGGIAFLGLVGAALAIPVYGVVAILPLGLAMPFVGFFLSHYLNSWSGSELRATVLSFRGVALNLGYGFAGLLFAGLTARLRTASPGASENEIFGASLVGLPIAFGVCAAAVALFAVSQRRALSAS